MEKGIGNSLDRGQTFVWSLEERKRIVKNLKKRLFLLKERAYIT